MTGQATLTGTITGYAGGSIQAVFQSQGGGKPAVIRVSTTIAGDGTFTLLAWDNSNAIYAPSQTSFIIQVGAATTETVTATIAGTSKDISSLFTSAPLPPTSFADITSGTNLSHGLVVGSGAVLTTASGGFINANEIGGVLVTNTPSASGKVLTSTSTSAATWQ